ncbi:Riboflavin kinase [Rubripirellula lacrimiformis]|uniref:Riboflavin biosynthesis protein n=1 Tax=Rubripirellula lacrimiformis TaxID=1930273 RepID=A0A517N681_9BACT|nr:bifunctional riboflavin kinase/FAD synthetase [Rubripirellula lacrimiformis]QDT02518.1 Riboflavin kinase [Rubripirellula lacrimiformis]
MTQIVPLANVTDIAQHRALGRLHGGAITIGNFDGVHIGHAALLRQVRKLADQVGGPAVAVVLDPHPATVLRPEHAPPRLTSISRRAELMHPLGIDALVVCDTTDGLLRLTADQFYQSLIRGALDAKGIVEGPNFFFGRGREGSIETLKTLSSPDGIQLQIAHPTTMDGEMVSSTRIRRLLDSGDVDQATALLGRPYRIRGTVVAGQGRGRTIGFPTANLSQIDGQVPAPGVYAGQVRMNPPSAAWNPLPSPASQSTAAKLPFAATDDEFCPAAIHIGPNPTFDDNQSTKVEIHLIDYDVDLYGQSLSVDFVARTREIIKFDSPAALVDQIQHDIQTIRHQLTER